jgi:hypothetical protein
LDLTPKAKKAKTTTATDSQADPKLVAKLEQMFGESRRDEIVAALMESGNDSGKSVEMLLNNESNSS